MAEHPPSATQPTTRSTRYDINHGDVSTAPMTQSPYTSSSSTIDSPRCDVIREDRALQAANARARLIIDGIDEILSSNTSDDPVPRPTSGLSPSNLSRQQFYSPLKRFCDAPDEIPCNLAFGGNRASQEGRQYSFGYGVRKPLSSRAPGYGARKPPSSRAFGYGARKPLSSREQKALISAMTRIKIGGNISQGHLN